MCNRNKRNCCRRVLCETKRLLDWNTDCVPLVPGGGAEARAEALSRCPFSGNAPRCKCSCIMYTDLCG